MLSKSRIQYINSLKIKKYREIHDEFIAEGSKLVTELMESSFAITSLYAVREWLDENPLPPRLKFEPMLVNWSEMERITCLSTPSPCLITAKIPHRTFETSVAERELILMLDQIKDPGNLGTIIRTADWFGFKHVICSPDTVDLYNPKTIQSTMGSVTRVNVFYQNLPEILEQVKGKIAIYGSLLDGENILSQQLHSVGIIVIGNESRGISDEVLRYVTDKIQIPAYHSLLQPSSAESLNASIANAIICYEFRRNALKTS